MMLKLEQPQTEDICAALRSWRIRSRLRQDAIANCLGVAQSQVSRWESGREQPRPHNIEAIRRLINGSDVDPLLALRHFVEHSNQHLLLLDDQNDIISRSQPFQVAGSQLDTFGWVLDPDCNPSFASAQRRYRAILAEPGGVVGMTITLPFIHQDEQWVVRISNTIHSIAGVRVCLCELSFAPAEDGETNLRIEEIRLGFSGEMRKSVSMWQH